MSNRIVQIATGGYSIDFTPPFHCHTLYVLTEDGQVYALEGGKWEEVLHPHYKPFVPLPADRDTA